MPIPRCRPISHATPPPLTVAASCCPSRCSITGFHGTHVFVGVIWLLVYSPDPDIGVINALINGAGGDPVSWLGRGDIANYAIILAYVWASTGFVMVVLSAALKGISQEVIEAARTDGATEWDIFRALDLKRLKAVLAQPVVVDLRNIYPPEEVQAAGLRWHGVGRPQLESA